MSDLPIAWLAFCGFAAFILFSIGYLVGAWNTPRDINQEIDRED